MFHARLLFCYSGRLCKPTTRHPAISLPDEVVQARPRRSTKETRSTTVRQSLCNRLDGNTAFGLCQAGIQYTMLVSYGLETTEKNPVITSVRIGSGAQDAGLKKGDRILQAQDQFVQAKIKRDLRSSNFYQNKEDIRLLHNTLEEVESVHSNKADGSPSSDVWHRHDNRFQCLYGRDAPG